MLPLRTVVERDPGPSAVAAQQARIKTPLTWLGPIPLSETAFNGGSDFFVYLFTGSLCLSGGLASVYGMMSFLLGGGTVTVLVPSLSRRAQCLSLDTTNQHTKPT